MKGQKLTKKVVSVLLVLVLTGIGLAATPPEELVYQEPPQDGNDLLVDSSTNLSGTGGSAKVHVKIWSGGDGWYYYTYRIENTAFSPYIKHLIIGNPTEEIYVVTGSNGTDTITPWSATAWVPGATSGNDVIHWMAIDSTTVVNTGESSLESPQFQFASQLPPASATTSLHQGTPSVSAHGLIAAPGRPETPRSAGFWKHQFRGKGKESGNLGLYLLGIKACSDVFGPDLTGIEYLDITYGLGVLEVDNNSDMELKARRQLFALWANVVSGRLNPSASVNYDPADVTTNATTIQEALDEIEATILDTEATLEELENVKDMAEILNCM